MRLPDETLGRDKAASRKNSVRLPSNKQYTTYHAHAAILIQALRNSAASTFMVWQSDRSIDCLLSSDSRSGQPRPAVLFPI